MAANRKATMKDIAIIAGVTTQTVSRALSGSNNVHPETKKKVIEIANSLNYIKNSSASILRSGSSKIIAVFYDNLKNIFFSLTFSQRGLKYTSVDFLGGPYEKDL